MAATKIEWTDETEPAPGAPPPDRQGRPLLRDGFPWLRPLLRLGVAAALRAALLRRPGRSGRAAARPGAVPGQTGAETALALEEAAPGVRLFDDGPLRRLGFGRRH